MRFDGAIEPHHGAPPASSGDGVGGSSQRFGVVKCRRDRDRCCNNSNTTIACNNSSSDENNNNNNNDKNYNNNTNNKDGEGEQEQEQEKEEQLKANKDTNRSRKKQAVKVTKTGIMAFGKYNGEMTEYDNNDGNQRHETVAIGGNVDDITIASLPSGMRVIRSFGSRLGRTLKPLISPLSSKARFSLFTALLYVATVLLVPLAALPTLVMADDDFFNLNGFSVSPDSTTPEFDYASRGQKKFGDKCENTLECGFPGSICDPKKRSCQCTEDLPATNHIDKCGKEAAVNESCFFNEQCEAKLYQTECRDGRCICRYELIPVWAKDNTVSCKGRSDRPTGNETYVDPAMIMVLVGMALMFIIICVVLRLFSQARWRENRTIFNTPNPRLMNVSLLRESKLLHGQERRGSRMSVRGPSRQPSMASLRPHSPNPSLGRMTRSKSNTRSSDSRVSDASNCSRLLEHPHNPHAAATHHNAAHHGAHHSNNSNSNNNNHNNNNSGQAHHHHHQQQQQQQQHQEHHHSQQQQPHHHHHHHQQQPSALQQQPLPPSQPTTTSAHSITTTTTYVPISPVGPNTACSISVTTPPPQVTVKTNKF